MILEIIGALFLLFGTVICIIGGIGLLRMPDFYTRAHAASVPDTLGAGCMIVGMICFTFALDGSLDYRLLIVVKLLSIAIFILVTSPIAGHAVTRAAFERGIGRHFDPKILEKGEMCEAEIIDFDVEIFAERLDSDIALSETDSNEEISDRTEHAINIEKDEHLEKEIDPEEDTKEVQKSTNITGGEQ